MWGRQHQIRTGSILRNRIKKILQAGHIFDLHPDSGTSRGGSRFPFLVTYGVYGELKDSAHWGLQALKARFRHLLHLCCSGLFPAPFLSLARFYGRPIRFHFWSTFYVFFFFFFFSKAAWSASTATSPASSTSKWREM